MRAPASLQSSVSRPAVVAPLDKSGSRH
jgi:hypothetical protein